MIEKVYKLYQGNDKKIEKLVLDERGHYMHMVLPKGDALPIHMSNADLFMTVVRGRLTISLNDMSDHVYPEKTMLQIPYQTKMNARNNHDDVLELIVVKTLPSGKEKI